MAKMDDAPARVTLLIGDDTISRERQRQHLLARIQAAHGDVSIESYDTDRETVSDFVERIVTPSLFGGVRVFTIRHAEGFTTDQIESLRLVLKTELPDEFLVVEAGAYKERTQKAFASFVKDAKKNEKKGSIAVHTFTKPPEYRVAEWLVSTVPSLMDRRISRTDAEYLVDLVGSDFDAIRSELDKIDLYLDEGQPLTRKAIDEVVQGTRSVGAFELAQALGRKDLARAMSLLDGLFSANFYAPLCISALYRHFWSLFKIRALYSSQRDVFEKLRRAQRGRDRQAQNRLAFEIGCAAGLLAEGQANRVYPVIIKSGVIDQALTFPVEHLRAVFRWLMDVDVGVKTGRVDATLTFMQLLCVRIVRGPSEPEDLHVYGYSSR